MKIKKQKDSEVENYNNWSKNSLERLKGRYDSVEEKHQWALM